MAQSSIIELSRASKIFPEYPSQSGLVLHCSYVQGDLFYFTFLWKVAIHCSHPLTYTFVYWNSIYWTPAVECMLVVYPQQSFLILLCWQFPHFVRVPVVCVPREGGLLPSPCSRAWASSGLIQACLSCLFLALTCSLFFATSCKDHNPNALTLLT